MNDFDSIIVGGGMSGLVAAATLAVQGHSVALIEQNPVLGGCCSSFTRSGYHFDSGTSSLSGLREGGMFRKILTQLELAPEVHRPEIRETLITPRFTIQIPSDPGRFKQVLLERFPSESDALHRLFDLLDGRLSGSHQTAGLTLNRIFLDLGLSDDLLLVFEALLGNIGLPASRVDGATGLALIREYVLDGGYYPVGGMKSLPRALGALIEQKGGKVMRGQKVEELLVDGDSFRSLRTASGAEHAASSCIAAMDARQVFSRIRSAPGLGTSPQVPDLSGLKPSTSAFMVFLGLNCRLSELTDHPGHLLHIPEGNMRDVYASLDDDALLFSPEGYVYVIVPSRIERAASPAGGETVCLFIMAPYRDVAYWKEHRQRMIDVLMARAERILPGLSSRVSVMDSATPLTIERYTGGSLGATYGWEATPDQSGTNRLSPVTPWRNLLLAGHWTRPGSGISAVAYSGYLAARSAGRLLKEERRVSRG